MRKSIISLFFLMSSLTMVAQTIVFSATKHDFGTIKQEDGDVTAYFDFTNEGTAPLLITNVRTSCGCTRPTWPKEPIEPGKKGTISATYRASTRPNYFSKTITVYSNDPEHASVVLSITGNVKPKPTNPADKYTVRMGELNLKSNRVAFGVLTQGVEQKRTVEYANLTDHDLTIDLFISEEQSRFLSYELSNNVLKPNESGNITFTIDTRHCPVGPSEIPVYVMVNDQVVKSDEFRMLVSVEVNEDFSQLSEEELRQAPILEVPTTLDMGIITAGKSARKSLTIRNAGISPLNVRRAYCSIPELTISIPKAASAVKSGKSATLTVNVSTNQKGKAQEAGRYSRLVSLYTNDPSKPKTNITILWTVQ